MLRAVSTYMSGAATSSARVLGVAASVGGTLLCSQYRRAAGGKTAERGWMGHCAGVCTCVGAPTTVSTNALMRLGHAPQLLPPTWGGGERPRGLGQNANSPAATPKSSLAELDMQHASPVLTSAPAQALASVAGACCVGQHLWYTWPGPSQALRHYFFAALHVG
jgi:hypothetical protein